MTMYPQKLKKGDKVAILSPSGGLPEVFPEIFDQGLRRLRDIFGLIPVEYPTTRILKSSLQSRVADLHQALTDPEIKAIICSIGGDDQIKLLKYLDKEIIKNNPKIFMGYSDATNLCQFFTQTGGFVTYYGPAIMTQFGASGKMDDYTVNYLQKALFENIEVEIKANPEYSEHFLDWVNISNLEKNRPFLDAPEWIWHNFTDQEIVGETWGGCLEIIDFQLRANSFLPQSTYLENKILYVETSEEIPTSDYVYRVFMGLGERGVLSRFKAVLVGRTRSCKTGENADLANVKEHRKSQKEAIVRACEEYAPKLPILFNLDFGHTDPIFIIPNGGNCRIDASDKKLFFTY